ncbi:hypothetical protein BASA81_002748 [Batrachochytrium salamandrivorans]|nr:hypothetical protein BASA81_002748 [Batrachochytrium salamandrivorans]
MSQHAVLRVGAHYQPHLLGRYGMTISRLSELSGAKLWLQTNGQDAFNLNVQGTPAQAKLAKKMALHICDSVNAMENVALLPELYNEWILTPSLMMQTLPHKEKEEVVALVPKRFQHRLERMQRLLQSSIGQMEMNNVGTTQIEVKFHPQATQDQIHLARNFIFNELFFSTHEAAAAVPEEHFDLLTRHSIGMRNDETIRYADGLTPFLTPRSVTTRVPTEMVTLNTYGLSDFFAQLERQTKVALTHTMHDVLPGKRDVSLHGESDVIHSAYLPLLDQLDTFMVQYPSWREQIRRGYLIQLGVDVQEMTKYLEESLLMVELEHVDVIMQDEEMDLAFAPVDVGFKRLPTAIRIKATWEAIRMEQPTCNATEFIQVRGLDETQVAFRMLQYAIKLESPKLANTLLEAVQRGKHLTWIRNRGIWQKRYGSIVFRLQRQLHATILPGRLHEDVMQYLEDFIQLIREDGMVFPKQPLPDYVDENELEDLATGEMYAADAEGDDD